MFKAMYSTGNTGSPLVVGFLLFVLTLPALQAQTKGNRVGLLMGYGRSYQVGTPGGSIDHRYMDFKSGSNFMIGGWYERQFAESPLRFRTQLYFMNRSHSMEQSRFSNNWLTDGKLTGSFNYEVLGMQLELGREFEIGNRLSITPYAGVNLAYLYMSSYTFSSSFSGAEVLPLFYRHEFVTDIDNSGFYAIEPCFGTRLSIRSQSKFWQRTSFWVNVQLPTRSLDEITYSARHQHNVEVVSYQGQWRSRTASWTAGVSFRILSWGKES